MTTDVERVPHELADPSAETTQGSWWITLLFATTSLVGAGLLFVVQPMVARLVLPRFGGSATVWSTSSLFFQVVLLIGYAYVHASTRLLGRRAQPILHLSLLLLPLVALPIALPPDAGGEGSPITWLLRTLALTVGLPFAVISTTGPLLQKWYSWTVGRRADDPYFLFATSNLGSFVGLLAYPFVVEPLLTLDQQRLWWSIGFGIFLSLMAGCGLTALASRRALPSDLEPAQSAAAGQGTVSAREVAIWLALAFLPSSLMLGVTAHLSTDIAAIPLMWVVPLAIYLATFVVAFARSSREVHPGWPIASAVTAVVATLVWMSASSLPVWLAFAVDLTLLATVAYTAHAQLAARRPSTAHLTTFFLIVATGGALGGLLNGLIAPLLLPAVWEYPVVVIASVLLAVPLARSPWSTLERRYHPGFVRFLEAALFLMFGLLALYGLQSAGRSAGLAVVVVLLWAGAGLLWSRRTGPLVVGLAALAVLPTFVGGQMLVQDRSFYGAYQVKDKDGWRVFAHGTTVHGKQSLDPSRALEPATYYARSGPVGDVMRTLTDARELAVIGLGTGTLAAYGSEGQRITFFEIDPDVVAVASNPALFSYVSRSVADVQFVVGDGRLRLEEQPAGSYDALFVDAFTSDAIPVHLLTREAFASYARALKPDGILLVHVSNRVFDLEPVVAAAADDLGWATAVGLGLADDATGATPSVWIALTPDRAAIDRLVGDDRWRPPGTRRVSWTDDFASILTALRLG